MKISEKQRVDKEGQYDPFYWDNSVIVSDFWQKTLCCIRLGVMVSRMHSEVCD